MQKYFHLVYIRPSSSNLKLTLTVNSSQVNFVFKIEEEKKKLNVVCGASSVKPFNFERFLDARIAGRKTFNGMMKTAWCVDNNMERHEREREIGSKYSKKMWQLLLHNMAMAVTVGSLSLSLFLSLSLTHTRTHIST